MTGRGGPPHLNIWRENTAISKSFQKRWHLLHAEVLLPQPLSKFILKAQSVYTRFRKSLNGIVPPFPFCFVLFLIMAIDLSDVLIHPTYFSHRYVSRCSSIAGRTFSWFWSQEAPGRRGWPRQTHSSVLAGWKKQNRENGNDNMLLWA